jgi:hypothetical protein
MSVVRSVNGRVVVSTAEMLLRTVPAGGLKSIVGKSWPKTGVEAGVAVNRATPVFV